MAAISQTSYSNNKKPNSIPSSSSSSSSRPIDSPSSTFRSSLQLSLISDDSLKHIRIKALSHDLDITRPEEDPASRDFGGTCFSRPTVVVYPSTPEDIALVMKAVSSLSSSLTASTGRAPKVAARGNGHSVAGHAQAADGVVIEMRALAGFVAIGRDSALAARGPFAIGCYSALVARGATSIGRESALAAENSCFYADVGGGLLWIEILDYTLRSSLSPTSFTDYLYLTVGGTLQNAGVGGQCFRHGPLISNVVRLDVITANGDIKCCSPTVNADLFYGSLGGLGQLGIISKARILLQPAPQKVRWIRLVYADFSDFTHDQEHLMNASGGFDYLEGFVVANNEDPVNGWPSILFSDRLANDAINAAHSSVRRLLPPNAGPVLYCLEVAKYYSNADMATIDQRVAALLRKLRFVAGLGFQVDVTYREFLDRVHTGEMKLQKAGLWNGSPHPWLCLFVPASQIQAFDALIFKSKLCKTGVGGPILVYPMLRSKWPRDSRCSAVIPDEEVFYMVALLRFITPSTTESSGSRVMAAAEKMVAENEEIVRLARAAGIKVKRYLPNFRGGEEAEEHFGAAKWAEFCRLKRRWDPKGLLAPGVQINFPEMAGN